MLPQYARDHALARGDVSGESDGHTHSRSRRFGPAER
jgi:hypothetical protein